ncbi:MAG TPA: substrate-binding domain-containing protein [Micromonosporaceae bacterium]
MTLAVLAAGGWFGYRTVLGPGCSGQVRITVAAAPEIAPVLQATVTDWTKNGGAVDGRCVAADVTPADPAEVAAAVATKHNVAVAGIGRAGGGVNLPDVWIPDSSMWLARLHAVAPGFTPDNAESIARSPVVLAMPEPVAAEVGWPEKQLGWGDLLAQIAGGSALRAGIVEPSRDAAGLSGLLAISAAAQAAEDPQTVTTALLRALATGKSALREDLLARFPRSNDAASIASALSAAALSEEDVIEYNAKRPPIPLAALYLEPAPPALDYPYAIMPGTDPVRAAAADRLFDAFTGSAFRDRLAARGLRAADGTGGNGFTPPRGAPETIAAAGDESGGAAAAGPDVAVIDRVISTWMAVTLPGRMLAVMDVSGSMFQRVPTANNATRMQVTLAAAQRGLDLFDDSWAVGLWVFSTQLAGNRDYRELVPIGTLAGQRTRLREAISQITPKPNGDTGLYDTLLAAYQTVQKDWQAGRVNSVVIFTDGKNEDANGISHARLLEKLKELADPEKPIQVIVIGIGTDLGQDELTAITEVTGGGVFIAEDPANIGDILLKAISLRPATVR